VPDVDRANFVELVNFGRGKRSVIYADVVYLTVEVLKPRYASLFPFADVISEYQIVVNAAGALLSSAPFIVPYSVI
jgi:hypothetical protein